MKKSVLKVQMFGTYSIEYEGNPVSFERNTTTKTNQLMQILLQAGEKGVTRAKLLSDLFGNEEMSNPSNSLRATVFRLRRLLAAAGLPEDEYVTIRGEVITGLPGFLMNWMRTGLRICWIRLGRKMTRRRKSLI